MTDAEYEKIYVRKETYPNFYMNRFISKFVLKNTSSLPEEALRKAFQTLIDEAISKSEEEARNRGIFGTYIFFRFFKKRVFVGKVYKINIVLNGFGLETPLVLPLRELEFNTPDLILNEIDLLEVENRLSNILFLKNFIFSPLDVR